MYETYGRSPGSTRLGSHVDPGVAFDAGGRIDAHWGAPVAPALAIVQDFTVAIGYRVHQVATPRRFSPRTLERFRVDRRGPALPSSAAASSTPGKT